jgi:hypothetical protein
MVKLCLCFSFPFEVCKKKKKILPCQMWSQGAKKWKVILLIDYLLFYVPLKNFSRIWRHHHYQWRAVKSRPMFGAQGLWAGRDFQFVPHLLQLQDLNFYCLIWSTIPFNHLLQLVSRECGGLIVIRIIRGPHSIASSMTHKLQMLRSWPILTLILMGQNDIKLCCKIKIVKYEWKLL